MKEYIRTSHSTGKDKGLNATKSGIISGTICILSAHHPAHTVRRDLFDLFTDLFFIER